jgi:glycogen debranching enzyme
VVQPHLHDHITCVNAPAVWLSPRSGQLEGGVDGLYVSDRRVLSRLMVALDGVAPIPIAASLRDPTRARFLGVVPGLGGPALTDTGLDPLEAADGQSEAGPTDAGRTGTGQTGTDQEGQAGQDGQVGQPLDDETAVTVERIRSVTRSGGQEQILVHNHGRTQVTTVLSISVDADLVPVSTVRAGRRATASAARPTREGLTWTAPDGFRVRIHGRLRAELRLAPGQSYSTALNVTATPPDTAGFRPSARTSPTPWAAAPLTVRSPDRRLDALVAQGVADLGALLLADDGDLYAAAGSPWYLTLFGRDALWTARLALPLGYQLAAGTLRTLARRQGARHLPATEEEPGKIPHELRPMDAKTWLPPVYYGSVDATPLFVITLAEARRWGMPDAEVVELLPAVERALGWLGSFDGFVSYRGSPGRLVNQGWKDSVDGIQHADGRLAKAPLALCEVQAYAYQAAIMGAELLDAHDRPGGERWRDWASALAERARSRFWLDGYPAVAVDGAGEPVDGAASNIGHLLGTGLLTADEEERVARRLRELDSGWGLRTLSGRASGFNPLSYHAGSVWPHDTAIAILGLARTGYHDLAADLAAGLIAASPYFGFRLPELYGGYSADPPVPYPAACRPQAWSAAVSAALVTALLGLEADVPAGTVRLRPLSPRPGTLTGEGELAVDNIRVGADAMGVRVGRDGSVEVTRSPAGLTVMTPAAAG